MFSNFLLTTFRNLWCNKGHSLINIASLTIGLTIFAFAFLYVQRELSFDHSWPQADRIHRLLYTTQGIPGLPDGQRRTDVKPYLQIADYFSDEISNISRQYSSETTVVFDDIEYWTNINFVDASFLNIFQLEEVEGSIQQVLNNPGFIALEAGFAASLSDTSMLGKRIKKNIPAAPNGVLEFEVGAVFSLPANLSSSLKFSTLVLIDELASEELREYVADLYTSNLWITLAPGITTDSLNRMQPGFIDEHAKDYQDRFAVEKNLSEHLFYEWQPVTDIHFHPTYEESVNGINRGDGSVQADLARVLTFAVIGLLVLSVGCSNSISLSLVKALERRREIGIRKTAGALQGDIFWQFLGEAIMLSLLALLLSAALLELLLPTYINLMNIVMPASVAMADYLILALVAVLVGIISGVYPARVLAAVRPQHTLKTQSGRSINTGHNLRNWLVAGQFCFATIFLIAAGAFYAQLQFTRTQPLGFSAENLLYVDNLGEGFRSELEKLPGVTGVAQAISRPSQNMALTLSSSVYYRSDAAAGEIRPRQTYIFPGFIEVLEIPLLAGRTFDSLRDIADPQSGLYNDQQSNNRETRLLINRSAARALGFNNPEAAVDQVIKIRKTNQQTQEAADRSLRIIGVVEDNMLSSIKRRPVPETYHLWNYSNGVFLALKFEESIKDTIEESVQNISQQFISTPLHSLVFIEPELQAAFIQEQNESFLLLICTALTLLLACTGLFGLAAFTIERNIKEVGIRKALGSSVAGIMKLFIWRFSKPVLIASLIACPVAVYFVLQWIKQFPYQLETSWLLPLSLGSTIIVLFIAILTVSVITARAARAKPVQSLRYE